MSFFNPTRTEQLPQFLIVSYILSYVFLFGLFSLWIILSLDANGTHIKHSECVPGAEYREMGKDMCDEFYDTGARTPVGTELVEGAKRIAILDGIIFVVIGAFSYKDLKKKEAKEREATRAFFEAQKHNPSRG